MPTAIQWTDETWNPTTGCTKVSRGCRHCYIDRTPAFRIAGRKFVRGATDLQLHTDRLDKPLHWRKPRRVFVNSLSDLFHEDIPDAFIESVFVTMARARAHTFQVLTKRPDRALALLSNPGTRNFIVNRATSENTGAARARGWTGTVEDAQPRWPLPNVWVGVSIEDNRVAWRADVLREIPAAVRFISAEPLLGSLYEHGRTRHETERDGSGAIDPSALEVGAERNLVHEGPRGSMGSPLCEEPGCRAEAVGPFDHLCYRHYREEKPAKARLDLTDVNWVIAGGESGPGARPCHLEHIREIVSACRKEDVAVFVKQLGAKPTFTGQDGTSGYLPLRDRKGGDIEEWPADLRIREFPRSAA